MEAVPRALHRYAWRARLRRLHGQGRLAHDLAWARRLAIPDAEARRIAALPRVGEIVAAVDRASPRLAYRPLMPRQLPGQIRLARLVLRCCGWRCGCAARPGPPAGRNGALGHRRRLNARFRKDTSFRGSRAEPWLWRETGALPRYPGKGMIPLRSRIYASSRVSPKIGSKAARRAMSTSGRLTMRPRSARLVTPCSRTPQGTMPENATGPARR